MNVYPTNWFVHRRFSASLAALWMAVAIPLAGGAAEVPALRVHPPEIRLGSPESSEQLLVFGRSSEGSPADVTRQAIFQASVAGVVEVTPAGRIVPLKDGRTEVHVRWNEHSASVMVEAHGIASPSPVSFHRDVVPILSKAGCNSGGCHGKAEGQNGFKLSVFGYDSVADYQALVTEGRGRRVFHASPEHSLLLRKATAVVPHGGGLKIEPDSRWDRLLRRWIQEGTALDQPVDHPISGIVVEPAEVTLGNRGTSVVAGPERGPSMCDERGRLSNEQRCDRGRGPRWADRGNRRSR